jgi:hypothetical protein
MDESVWRFGGRHLGNVVSEDAFKEIVTLRRKLHARPELAFQEIFTSTTGIQIGCAIVFTDYNRENPQNLLLSMLFLPQNCNAHKSVRS